MIKVSGLTKWFGAVKAVGGVSFEIGRGEVVGFLGPNGAGKSTTLRMITCYLSPDAGAVEVDGHDSVKESLDVRALIGYLPENNPLYPDMTPTEYLSFIAGMRGIARGEIEGRVRKVEGMTRLGEMASKPIGRLSKGFRQRVGLAAAMIHDPEYLILDEPTSGLDPIQIIEVRNLIREISRKKSVIISTHILQEVTAICDRVIIIDNGGIVFESSIAGLPGRAGAGEVVHAGIEADAAQVKVALGKLEDVKEVKLLSSDEGGRAEFEIVSPAGKDVSVAVFELAAANGWKLHKLVRETVTLETVFLDCTRGERIAVAESEPGAENVE